MNPSLARVAVALDTPEWSTFETWCDLFGSEVGVLKVGLEAFVRWGARAVERAGKTPAAIFLDLKLHDIPQTVAGATAAARTLGVRYLTVHASGGGEMLRSAVEAAQDETKILAITVLTHLGIADLESLGLPGAATERALLWATLARDAGASGAVCSAWEVARIRQRLSRPFALVTPGIRPAGASRDDQSRIATPREAMSAGADLLVIGRPLTRAKDPERALADLAVELAQAAREKP